MPPPDPKLSFRVAISLPFSGAELVGPASGVRVSVSGTAEAEFGGDPVPVRTPVQVALGPGTFQPSRPGLDGTWARWSFGGTVRDGGPLTIRAKLGTAEVFRRVAVILDGEGPRLTVDAPPPLIDPGPGPHDIRLEGTAIDTISGVESVKVNADEAENQSGDWSNWEASVTLATEGTHSVTVVATDKAGNRTSKGFTTRLVNSLPIVKINNQSPDTATWTGEDMTYEVLGTASDAHSDVDRVEWRVGDAPYQLAENPNGDWSTWRALVPIPAPGEYEISVRAMDQPGNLSSTATLFLEAVPSFEREAPLSLTAYLDDLLLFATLHVAADESGTAISRELLAETFHQPFDSLADPSSEEIATRPVHRVRLCIEILRHYLDSHGQSQPTEAEFEYRQAAYHTLLSNLGTSYEEIRLARAADGDTREALADRLGIGLDPARPDQLDSLFLQPDQISEDALEQLFGLPDTVSDPLAPDAGDDFDLLIWRREHLRTLWSQQDLATRSSPEAPLPIIDPDLITVNDLKDPAEGNPAFDLWDERRAWVAEKLDEIRADRESAAGTLQGFDEIVAPILGPVSELEDLAEDRENGIDIRSRLEAMLLDNQAFLYLIGIHRLVVTESTQDVELVLNSEWKNVYSILVQVLKRRKYDDWRQEEEGQSLVLSPTFFKLPDPDSSTAPSSFELPDWRATRQARDAWQDILAARIEQKQTVEKALWTAVGTTEETSLPLLRQALIAAIADAIGEEDLGLVADELTSRLLIDMKSSGGQRTTRAHQTIETVQGIHFALRAGRFKKAGSVLGPNPAAGWILVTADETPGGENAAEGRFDEEWVWMGSFATWRAAMFVFGYPENYLLPTLRESEEQTGAFGELLKKLPGPGAPSLTPQDARSEAQGYLEQLRTNPPDDLPDDLLDALDDLAPSFEMTEQLSNADLADRRAMVKLLFEQFFGADVENPHLASTYFKEIFYFVPIQVALQLQRSGQYLAALDWFQTVYAYNLPVGQRKIYYGLTLEANLPQEFGRPTDWLLRLNPHEIAEDRADTYTRFTLILLVRCLLEFADSEFTQGTSETIPRARTLYMTALNLLDLPEMQPLNSEEDATSFPPNPVFNALRRHAESNLFKIRNDRNIAGMERQVELDGAKAGTVGQLSNLPHIGSGGELIISRPVSVQPTPYRYSTLIERAKQLVSIAEQIEAAFLSALEKRDAEAYNLLRAHQDIHLTEAAVQLQDLRVDEAVGGVGLARLQQGRARIRSKTYQEWIDAGFNEYEQNMLDNYEDINEIRNELANINAALTVAQSLAAVESGGFLGTGLGAGYSGTAIVAGLAVGRAWRTNVLNEAEKEAQVNAFKASFERRKDEWQLQKSLAEQDLEIGAQQIALAQDHRQVVAQERVIAGLQADHAKAEVEFLATKFTNVDLFEWMSGILGRVYSYFLQQATAIAQLAQSQLAFERQETPPSFIQADYWHAPVEAGATISGDGQTPDRRGLTGSARLLQDIYRLDQYAFETNKRKLQLSQTFSLARLAPAEFQRFRETGVLPFATPMELFDRGFPGHYLRLIKRVRTSVVALIPPNQGVRATLTASGLSRVVVGGSVFQTMVVRRSPELIAFTSPSGATGLFELEPEGEMLLPFESMGVDTAWELELPKAANPFDFRTIADVLVTIEYTALTSFDYRQQVIQQLDRSISTDLSFSFRQEFADAWYDLHNSEQSDLPMTVSFTTRREDFPPNVQDLEIEHLLLYFARADGASFEVPVTHLNFTSRDGEEVPGGGATTIGGVISTRRANGASWIPLTGNSPVGEWELALPDTPEVRAHFENEEIEDVLFVVTYSGRTPAWPQ